MPVQNLNYNIYTSPLGFEGRIATSSPLQGVDFFNKSGDVLPIGRLVIGDWSNLEMTLPDGDATKPILGMTAYEM